MLAAVYTEFRGPLTLQRVPDPDPGPHGAVLRVAATGICRSDWHGWMGHDPDITLPHVPGHELAGTVAAVGREVRRWRAGDRVTVPFVCGCGSCGPCRAGQQQVCDRQTQPGFTHWGSYAEYVRIDHADINLVSLPDSLDFVTAASLGCRFATAWRAVVAQGRLREGEYLAVHGCGGVGLSALMIGAAFGGRTVAVDIDPDRLATAESLGAKVVDATSVDDVPAAIRDLSEGGAHVSLDALGSEATCLNSILCLRKQGRHVQVGLMVAEYRSPPLPMDRILSDELEIRGSHGVQAHAYPDMLDMIAAGRLDPARLVASRLSLADAAAGFADERHLHGSGICVIEHFDGRQR